MIYTQVTRNVTSPLARFAEFFGHRAILAASSGFAKAQLAANSAITV